MVLTVNYIKTGSYERRVLGETQVHSRGPSWHLSLWKKLTEKSPGKLFKRNISRRIQNIKNETILGVK